LAPDAILRKTKIRSEDIAVKAADDPTADLTSRVRECQVQVLRIMKTSGNLKGTFQPDLKAIAATMLGLLEVLKTRADRSAQANSKEDSYINYHVLSSRYLSALVLSIS